MAGLLDEEDLMPFFGNPNIQRQGAKARALAAKRDVNTLPDPKTYAAVQGLLGTAPDQMGFSVLNPNYQAIMNVAKPSYGLGVLSQLSPILAPMTKGLPVGAGIVYHGTPHRFPPTAKNPLGEFDASKIGTGEGAQVYGHGIYTAENPAVAKEYQRQLGTQMKYKGEQFYDPIVGRKTGTTGNTELDDYLLSYLGDTGVIRKELLTAAKEMRAAKNPQALKEYQALMGELRKVRPDVTAANTGSLYKVDLPDEKIAQMLDYDKTWKQQPENVRNAINVDSLLKYYGTEDMPTSQVLYHAKQSMSPASFAEFLRGKGVPGIKYLDEGSRAEGKGTRNFVVFPGEEKSMNILEREEFGGLLGY